MGYMDLVRQGVAIINQQTADMQATVQYERYEETDGAERAWAAAQPLKAVVEYRVRQVRTPSGILGTSTCTVMFVDLPALMTATLNRGVNVLDVIKVQNAPDMSIVGLGGFQDPGNGLPIPTEVYLG